MPYRTLTFVAMLAAFIFLANIALVPTAPREISVRPERNVSATSSHVAAASASVSSVATTTTATTTPPQKPTPTATAVPKKPSKQAIKSSSREEPGPDPKTVVRLENPYSVPPLPFDQVNVDTRSALVNILCQPRGGSLRPISASGVIIDPRGVILTNAHVAQYVLLSQSPDIDLSCVIRTGAPARAAWRAQVLYMPSVWVDAHAHEISAEQTMGTGEHDFALLIVSGSATEYPLPSSFPYLLPDTRDRVAFTGDPVLVASYPAEFVGGIAAQTSLYAASSITSVGQLVTLAERSVDLISVGGVIEAQSGSSGGAVVNAWDRLVGIIVTTSEGATTGERDLRALTLSYIDRDIKTQSGKSLSEILGGDVFAYYSDFSANHAPNLFAKYVPVLRRR